LRSNLNGKIDEWTMVVQKAQMSYR